MRWQRWRAPHSAACGSLGFVFFLTTLPLRNMRLEVGFDNAGSARSKRKTWESTAASTPTKPCTLQQIEAKLVAAAGRREVRQPVEKPRSLGEVPEAALLLAQTCSSVP